MPLKFFWDCENSLTLQPTDYSSGDNVASNSSTSFSVAAAKTGSYGLTGAADVLWSVAFTATDIWPSAANPAASAGCIGFWAQSVTGGFNNGQSLTRCIGATTSDKVGFEGSTNNSVSLNCQSVTGGGSIEVKSADNSVPAGEWRFIVGRWDIANDKLAIEIYADAGDNSLTLIDAVEGVDLGLVVQSTPFATLTLAQHAATEPDVYYYDHFLISDVYGAPLQNNAFITDYVDYTESLASAFRLRLVAHPDAAGQTAVDGVVFEAPVGGDMTGARIGEFTGQSFEATLEGGAAVMYVPITAFSGDFLTASDNPVAFARNAVFHTDMTPCTVVET